MLALSIGHRLALALLALASVARADTAVDGAPPIGLRMLGLTITGQLRQRPGATAGSVTYFIRYTGASGAIQELPLRSADARDVLVTVNDFARLGRTYQIARTTEGYAQGTPVQVTFNIVPGGDGTPRLERYSDMGGVTRDRMAPTAGDPLFATVRYSFRDASRLGGDPHGPIQLGADGTIQYVTYHKELRPFELHHLNGPFGTTINTGRPTVPGVYPSVEAALAAARGTPPDVSGLRYACDFGPQYNGIATAGAKRPNQLMPIVPIGMVRHGGTGQTYVAALPLDQLQAYRRGEIGREAILLLPPDALRFVHAANDWQRIVEDYLDLRATGRGPERIFVANHRPGAADGGGSMMTMNSVSIAGIGRHAERFNNSIDGLRDSIPPSILDWRRPRPPNDCAGPMGDLQ